MPKVPRTRYRSHLFAGADIPKRTERRKRHAAISGMIEANQRGSLPTLQTEILPPFCMSTCTIAADCDSEGSEQDLEIALRESLHEEIVYHMITPPVFDEVLEFLRICRRHRMSRIQQDSILKFFRGGNRSPNFPENLYKLDIFLKPHLIAAELHFFCPDHQNYIGESANLIEPLFCQSRNCESTRTLKKDLLKKGAFFHTFSVKDSLQRYFLAENKYVNRSGPAWSLDVHDGDCYKKLRIGEKDWSLTIHIDSGQTFGINGSENGKVTAVSYLINELPSRKRYRQRFLYAVCVGVMQPNAHILLRLLADELRELACVSTHNSWGRIIPALVVADAVARMDILFHSSYAADSGCTMCLHEGVLVCRKRVYPFNAEITSTPKLRAVYINASREALESGIPVHGIVGPTELLRLPSIDPALSCPPDLLHAICLGQYKKMLFYWIKGNMADLPIYTELADKTAKILGNARLLEVDLHINCIKFPSEFPRAIPPITQSSKYHGSEFLHKLLYGSFYVLDGQLPIVLFENLMDLVMAVHLLLMDHTLLHGSLHEHAALAKQLLERFCKRFEELYGQQRMLYNTHQLLHFPDALLNWGPSYHWSTFCFEDFLGRLLRSIHGSTDLASQLIRNYQHMELVRRFENRYREEDWIQNGNAKYKFAGRPARFLSLSPKITAALLDFFGDENLPITVSLFSAILRDDNVSFECMGYGRKQKRTNTWIQTMDNRLALLLLFFHDVKNNVIGAVVDVFASVPYNEMKMTNGESPGFIRKCSRQRETSVLFLADIFRHAVVIIPSDAETPTFAVFIPNHQHVM